MVTTEIMARTTVSSVLLMHILSISILYIWEGFHRFVPSWKLILDRLPAREIQKVNDFPGN